MTLIRAHFLSFFLSFFFYGSFPVGGVVGGVVGGNRGLQLVTQEFPQDRIHHRPAERTDTADPNAPPPAVMQLGP